NRNELAGPAEEVHSDRHQVGRAVNSLNHLDAGHLIGDRLGVRRRPLRRLGTPLQRDGDSDQRGVKHHWTPRADPDAVLSQLATPLATAGGPSTPITIGRPTRYRLAKWRRSSSV